MRLSHRTAGAALLTTAVLASTASAALALPPPDDEPIIRCPTGYALVDDVCIKLPPPPPSNSPAVSLDLARQTTNRAAVRVTGRATDADQPATALTIRIAVDGVLVKTATANLPDDEVATQYYTTVSPVYPGGHRYDVTVPAPANAQNVCVTAVNVGSTGTNKTVCSAIDNVVEFSGNSISYDVAKAEIKSNTAEVLDRVSHVNNTAVQQSTSIGGSKTVTNTHSWSITTGLKVSLKTKAGVPLIGESEITVEGSFSFTTNSTETTTEVFSWQQPVLVPAKSEVVATVAVTKTRLEVPYKIVGDYVYDSGFRAPGSEGGMFTGVNGHDLQVRIDQFNLDGTPAARPVDQPEATLRRER